MQEVESVIFRMIGIIQLSLDQINRMMDWDLLGKILGRRIADVLKVSIIISDIPGRNQESGSSASRRSCRSMMPASQIRLLEILFAVSIINSIPVRYTQKYSDEIHWELKVYGTYHFTRRNWRNQKSFNDAVGLQQRIDPPFYKQFFFVQIRNKVKANLAK